jgi:hypothetical protein
MSRPSLLTLVACCLTALSASHAQAALTLTPTGTGLGFSLTTFVSGYSAQYGPLSQGILADGKVITGSLLGTKIYVFNDVDNQTLGNAVSSVSYTCQTGNCNYSMTTAGGQVYGAQAQGGTFVHFDASGATTPIPNLQAAGVVGNLGMWGNPVDGHLIASSNKGLLDINPLDGSFRVVNANLFPDGVTVSPNGQVVYVENGGTVQSYNLVNGALLNTYLTGHSPDGTGVITGGNLNGMVVVNNNDGTVGLLDPTKANGDPNQFRIIASGGTRGDFVSPDTTNGTLFLSQNDRVSRLSCGVDCAIGSTPPVPEPATTILMLAGLLGMGLARRRSEAAADRA